MKELRSSIHERVSRHEAGRGVWATARATTDAYIRLLSSLSVPDGARVASLSCGFGNWDYITLHFAGESQSGLARTLSHNLLLCARK